MDSWKAWAVLFITTCITAVVLAYLDYWEAAVGTVSISSGLGIVLGFLGFLRRGREIRHHERMAMIEKGIYIEARKHDSGAPSLLVVLLVGIGLATVIASDVEFFGFVLLFVGIGLVVRSRLLHNRNQEQAVIQQARPGPVPDPGAVPDPGVDPDPGPSADPGTGEQTAGKKNGG